MLSQEPEKIYRKLTSSLYLGIEQSKKCWLCFIFLPVELAAPLGAAFFYRCLSFMLTALVENPSIVAHKSASSTGRSEKRAFWLFSFFWVVDLSRSHSKLEIGL